MSNVINLSDYRTVAAHQEGSTKLAILTLLVEQHDKLIVVLDKTTEMLDVLMGLCSVAQTDDVVALKARANKLLDGYAEEKADIKEFIGWLEIQLSECN